MRRLNRRLESGALAAEKIPSRFVFNALNTRERIQSQTDLQTKR